jgi:succinate dehydrogenase / fumarate reductase cytochrome b subunit
MKKSVTTFYGTSVGKKVVMAVSGFIVFGFVVVHIIGNLQLFAGPSVLNSYAEFLQNSGGIKLTVRGILSLSLIVHIIAATQLTVQSLVARPAGYAIKKYSATTYAARTMRWGGPMIGLFIIYHLLHLTTGYFHPVPEGFVHHAGEQINVYNNVVYGFKIWWASAIYIVAMILVGLHLYHGVWSMLQSIGVSHKKWNKWRNVAALLFALFVTLAGISLPLAVLTGFVQPV